MKNDDIRLLSYDYEIRMRIEKMCKTCRFYKEGCSKKRDIRECARKGLKNV